LDTAAAAIGPRCWPARQIAHTDAGAKQDLAPAVAEAPSTSNWTEASTWYWGGGSPGPFQWSSCGEYRTTFHWLSWIMPGERITLSQDRLSSGSGANPPTGLLPPPLPPPLRAPLTPVPLVQREYHLPLPLAGYQSLCVTRVSALCSVHLHSALMLIFSSLLTAQCYLLTAHVCICSKHLLVCSSRTIATARQVARCCRMHILTSFTTHVGCCSTHVR
jgi:hypothetical protein